jgi:hypothetical protein
MESAENGLRSFVPSQKKLDMCISIMRFIMNKTYIPYNSYLKINAFLLIFVISMS